MFVSPVLDGYVLAVGLWAEDLELSEEEGMAKYQILLNYMKNISEQIDARVASGQYDRDLTPLLLPVEEE